MANRIKFSKTFRNTLFALHDNICAYCTQAEAEEIEHIIPLSENGTNELNNLLPSCGACNRKKSIHFLPASILSFLQKQTQKHHTPEMQKLLEDCKKRHIRKTNKPNKYYFGYNKKKHSKHSYRPKFNLNGSSKLNIRLYLEKNEVKAQIGCGLVGYQVNHINMNNALCIALFITNELKIGRVTKRKDIRQNKFPYRQGPELWINCNNLLQTKYKRHWLGEFNYTTLLDALKVLGTNDCLQKKLNQKTYNHKNIYSSFSMLLENGNTQILPDFSLKESSLRLGIHQINAPELEFYYELLEFLHIKKYRHKVVQKSEIILPQKISNSIIEQYAKKVENWLLSINDKESIPFQRISESKTPHTRSYDYDDFRNFLSQSQKVVLIVEVNHSKRLIVMGKSDAEMFFNNELGIDEYGKIDGTVKFEGFYSFPSKIFVITRWNSYPRWMEERHSRKHKLKNRILLKQMGRNGTCLKRFSKKAPASLLDT